jgi:hypothetical protein
VTAKADDKRRADIDSELSQWRQGDGVVGEEWFVHRFAPDAALSDESAAAEDAGTDLVETLVRGFVVVSQTCDIVRPCADRPYVEIAVLVDIDPMERPSIARGRRPRYLFVPGLERANLVGDLDRVMTVEKAVVARWKRVPGCATDAESRELGRALARKRVRFAFPDDFTVFTAKLQKRLQEKHDRKTQEGEALRALREIRVRAAPSWAAASVELMFLFVRNEDALVFQDAPWGHHLESWLKLLPAEGRFIAVEGVVTTLDDVTARDYLESDPLDLDRLSRPIANG